MASKSAAEIGAARRKTVNQISQGKGIEQVWCSPHKQEENHIEVILVVGDAKDIDTKGLQRDLDGVDFTYQWVLASQLSEQEAKDKMNGFERVYPTA